MIIRNARERFVALHQRRQARKAFTLMEILVVVAIIVALAGIGGYFLIGQLVTSRIDIARVQTKELAKMCDAYYTRYNDFPQNLAQLINTPNGVPILKDQKALTDPWGRPYAVQVVNYVPVVASGGPDGNTPITSAD